MPDPTVSKVLEAVAEVAGERDLDNLRRSLLQSAREVLRLDDARFVRLPLDRTGQRLLRSADVAAAAAALEAGRAYDAAAPGGGRLRLLPVARDEALAIRAPTSGLPEEQRVIHALLRLYANFSELIAASQQDRLTGLLNRRSFDAVLAQVAEASVQSEPQPSRGAAAAADAPPARYWLALFDVDHFKRINDRFGHLYGDEVLLLLSRLLRQRFRSEDRCFRYGGEEFAVILAPVSASGARAALERLRLAVENHAFPQVGQVTISVGCAELVPGLGPLDVIDRADRALYEAKRGGRNRVVCAAAAAGDGDADHSFGEVELF